MRWSGKAKLAALIAACALCSACASLQTSHPAAPNDLSTNAAADDSAFGGIPFVTLPPDARVMSEFLKAEVASNEGDRKNALIFYEGASQADPHDAQLRLKLASMYVRDGRLKEALAEVKEALVLD